MKKSFLISIFFVVAISLLSVSCGKKSSDPVAGPAAPIIAVTFPQADGVDTTEFFTSSQLTLSAQLTSGSKLMTLTASVSRKENLKAISVPWAPADYVVNLNNTSAQQFSSIALFSLIDASAQTGIYVLKLVVKDSDNQTVTKEVPFKIVTTL